MHCLWKCSFLSKVITYKTILSVSDSFTVSNLWSEAKLNNFNGTMKNLSNDLLVSPYLSSLLCVVYTCIFYWAWHGLNCLLSIFICCRQCKGWWVGIDLVHAFFSAVSVICTHIYTYTNGGKSYLIVILPSLIFSGFFFFQQHCDLKYKQEGTFVLKAF